MARKILLADDSVTAQNMGRKILTDAGYEVITVNNGSAALKRIAEQEPDLIVLDVYMPGYSGLEVCQRIKENHQTARIPILLTVGKLEPFKPEEARKARADAYIIKPFEASELLVALTKLEDKIVPKPEPYKPGRFAKAIAAVEQVNQSDSGDGFGDSELGWKDRLRFPSKKAKAAEPDPEPEVQFKRSRGFRDLPAEDRQKLAEADQSFERPIPAGLPKDITAEEIAAISAAAAKLQGREDSTAADSPSASPEAKSQPAETQEQSAYPADTAASAESPAPLASGSAATDSPTASNAAAETPAAAEELPPVTLAGVPEPSSESHPPDTSATETIAAVGATSAEAAEAAPADSSDGDSRRDHNEQRIAARSEVTAETQVEPAAGDHAGTEPAAPESVATQAASPEAVSASEAESVAQSEAAGDAEVMAALQNLSPASGQGWHAESTAGGSTDHSSTNPYASLVEPPPATVAASASSTQSAELGENLSGPRWIAEAMPLGSDEATIILEKEMEKAYAAFAAAEAAPGVFAHAATTVTSGDSVNLPLASLAASAPSGRDETQGFAASDVKASETASVLAPDAPATAEDSGKPSPLPESAVEPAASAPEDVAAVAPQETSAAPPAESAAVAAAASGSCAAGWSSMPSPPASDAVSAPSGQARSGGQDEIEKKDAELAAASAAAWANWRQIRDTIIDSTTEAADAAAAAADDLGEDESGTSAAESPASAAPSSDAPVSDAPISDTPVSETAAAAPDAIASIVDSVLAELKPKLVEEIARKMKNDKKKKKE